MSKSIYLLLGPSGSGKTTLGYYLRDKLNIPELISSTTRTARQGEINGVNYYFITEEEFNKQNFIEKVLYSGNYYGTSIKEIDDKLDKNEKVYAIVDINGVNAMKKIYKDKVKIIYCKCDPKLLYERMLKRGDNEIKAKERIDYLYNNGELDLDRYADIIIHTDKYSLEECKQIIKIFVE